MASLHPILRHTPGVPPRVADSFLKTSECFSADLRAVAGGEGKLAISKPEHSGALIINADDWGRDKETTERIFECVAHGSVSSVSAMVFMEDSERAAEMASHGEVDAGLHLNLTTGFSASNTPSRLREEQQRVASFLGWNRIATAIYNPLLTNSFEYAVQSQLEEFRRLHGKNPDRIDGHHHMHLCANVLFAQLLPKGTIVRRNFSFGPGEKSLSNRLYRKAVDKMLARRHWVTEFFFSLPPIETPRLGKIFALAREYTVEVETHPVNLEEYEFLMTNEFLEAGISPSSFGALHPIR